MVSPPPQPGVTAQSSGRCAAGPRVAAARSENTRSWRGSSPRRGGRRRSRRRSRAAPARASALGLHQLKWQRGAGGIGRGRREDLRVGGVTTARRAGPHRRGGRSGGTSTRWRREQRKRRLRGGRPHRRCSITRILADEYSRPVPEIGRVSRRMSIAGVSRFNWAAVSHAVASSPRAGGRLVETSGLKQGLGRRRGA